MKDDAELRRRLKRMLKARFAEEAPPAQPCPAAQASESNAPTADASMTIGGGKAVQPRPPQSPPAEPSGRASEILNKLPPALRNNMKIASSLETYAGNPKEENGGQPIGVFRPPRMKKVTLEEAVEHCGAEATNEDGPFYLVERSIGSLCNEGDVFRKKYLSVMTRGMMRPSPQKLPEEIRAILEVPDEEIIYLDLETLGLGGERVFLIGTLRRRGDDIVARQFLARDYSEEAAIIRRLLLEEAPWQAVISYNGKAFDVPTLRCRAAVHHLPWREPAVHLDLLHEARRRWGRRLLDCRLQTIEMKVCRRSRHNDIPGCEIPQAYHDFVNTGNAIKMGAIIRHNALDLLTLAQLMHAILSGEEGSDD